MRPVETTIIFRHQKENLKKCSLKGLASSSDFLFFAYPKNTFFERENYILLTPEAPILTQEERNRGLLLIDATWRLAHKMKTNIKMPTSTICRSLPVGYKTAYPRRQDDFVDPTRGLASIEALYVAYHILGYDGSELLKEYLWAPLFLEKNRELFQ